MATLTFVAVFHVYSSYCSF